MTVRAVFVEHILCQLVLFKQNFLLRNPKSTLLFTYLTVESQKNVSKEIFLNELLLNITTTVKEIRILFIFRVIVSTQRYLSRDWSRGVQYISYCTLNITLYE